MPRSITARFAEQAPSIDGRLDDPIWASIVPETGFRRDSPSDGRPAAQRSEVRVAFDRDALYIGARLHDDRPDKVSRRLGRRDAFGAFNDVFFVLLDSYHDHRNQYVFGVTPAGQRRDGIASNDGLAQFDIGWDPVWEARTAIDSLGWVAEMRIPFSQLRFPDDPAPIWGIQFRRDIRRDGEAVDWQWSPRSEPGYVSKFGHLLGLRDIPPPGRLELLPYASSQARLTEGVPSANPFDDGSVASAAGGLDLKYGLTTNLTLSATVNPDFGQVEADPSVVNLTAFETFFGERRPFFVEGSDIFRFGAGGGGSRFFYSRRVGSPPSRSAKGSALFVDEPPASSILGAAKLSGRLGSGWSIGVLDALTGREFARTAGATGTPLDRVAVQPLSNYGVVRIKREVAGGSGGYGMIVTSVNRQLNDPGFAVLRRAAYAGAVDFFHRWSGNQFQLDGYVGWSRIEGDPDAMTRAQIASARYFQRPDQDYLSLDPEATSLTGYTGEIRFNKVGGDWRFGLSATTVSPGFEQNDAGFQTDADRIRIFARVSREWVQPTRLARSASLWLGTQQHLNFGGNQLTRLFELGTNLRLHDFSNLRASLLYRAVGVDDRSTRGGPLVERPAAGGISLGYGTDGRRPIAVGVRTRLNADVSGSSHLTFASDLTLQTTGGASIQLSPQYDRFRFKYFYLATYDDPTATTTFARRYVFAPLRQNVLSVQARLNLYFTPTLSLQLYAQPFVATADFATPASLDTPRSFDFSTYGDGGSTQVIDPETGSVTIDADGDGPASSFTYGNVDFRQRSLRSNVVLRWEYRPGSTLFFVWNQARFNQIEDPSFRPFGNVFGIFGDDMQNVFLIKANYHFSL